MITDVKWSELQRVEVIEQLRSILSDHRFRTSKRCVKFLEHVVQMELAGDRELAKERTIGVEVFGRNPDYDTNADPVVRATASEVRKRLALYYEGYGAVHPVRIHLIPGSYLPEFEFNTELLSPADFAPPGSPKDVFEEAQQPTLRPQLSQPATAIVSSRLLRLAVLVAAFLLFSAGITMWVGGAFRSNAQKVWAPFMHTRQPLILCTADDYSLISADDTLRAQIIAGVLATRIPTSPQRGTESIPAISFPDAIAVNQLTDWLAANGTQTSLRRATRLGLQDFRRGPSVLVGDLDNPWAWIFLSGLRFTVRIDPVTHIAWIRDAQNPGKRDWSLSTQTSYNGSYEDYALVTRFFSRETGQWVLALGGLGSHGTKVASDLLTLPDLQKELPPELRSQKNTQVVIEATIINGTSSAPRIVAVHSW